MKRITLFLTVCLGLSAFQTAFAVDSETVRAANKRSVTNTVSSNTSTSRANTSNSKQKPESTRTENARSVVNKNARNIASVQNRTTTKKQSVVKQRTGATSTTKNVTTRVPSAQRRNVSSSRTATRQAVSPTQTSARAGAIQQKNSRNVRAAELDGAKITAIKSRDYSKCRTVYQDCMDEFCANKDTSLRRCACSARIHEFDGIKKQLSNVEEQMFGFNQRLLTVGMDKEDALSINRATEGETAFSQTDKSESEKLLQKITQTLNSSSDSKITNNLSAISLDLDMDSAWDSVDSLSGVSTTAKSGLDLYNAAQPVCIEMAKEICSDEELEIAENSYKLSIQNDCNTVSKAYTAKYNTAIDKVHESSALLDMARLNAYQQRNSDDILTCKKKMLNQLSDSSVCGEQLYKCLDITGQYIDPSTGDAFLSADLMNITTLLTAPTDDTKWSRLSDNKAFVNFLNSKKAFLETATEQCQDLANDVWDDFIEDALAQIKLAQNAKLEKIRRSCVTLIAECKSNAYKTLEDFDVRALSTFAVAADTTVNTMCKDIQDACLTLVEGSDWTEGLAGLSSDISKEKMIENCTTIGQTCMIQKCSGISGDFALCDATNEPMRSSILNLSTCWQDVFNCVSQSTNIDYSYNIQDDGYLNCTDKYADNESKQKICRVAHKIWGDCQSEIGPENTDNKIIKTPEYANSLLYWFQQQTGNEFCVATECNVGFIKSTCTETCQQAIPLNGTSTSEFLNWTYAVIRHVTDWDADTVITIDETIPMPQLTSIGISYEGYDDHTYDVLLGYCQDGCNKKDKYGNCCLNHVDTDTKICVPNENYKPKLVQTVTCNGTDSYYCAGANDAGKTIGLYCLTKDPDHYPKLGISDDSIDCGNDGIWTLVDQFGNYFGPAIVTGPNYSPIYPNDEIEMSILPNTNEPDATDWPYILIRYENGWKHCNTSECQEMPTKYGPAGGSPDQHFYIQYHVD